MHQQHDGLDALALQLGHQRVDGVGLVAKLQPGHAAGHHHARCAFERDADEGHRNAVIGLDGVGREQRLAAGQDPRVGGQVLKARAGERLRALAAVGGVAAAVLQAQQLGLATVQLVVAHRSHRHAHQVQGLDGGLVAKQRRQQRRRANQVTRSDKDVVGRLRAQGVEQRGHGLDTAGGHVDALLRVGRVARAKAARRRFQVAVQVVDGQQLQAHRGGGHHNAASAGGRRWCGGAGCQQQQRRRGQAGQQGRGVHLGFSEPPCAVWCGLGAGLVWTCG